MRVDRSPICLSMPRGRGTCDPSATHRCCRSLLHGPSWQVVVTGEGGAEEKGELLRPLRALGPVQVRAVHAACTLHARCSRCCGLFVGRRGMEQGCLWVDALWTPADLSAWL